MTFAHRLFQFCLPANCTEDTSRNRSYFAFLQVPKSIGLSIMKSKNLFTDQKCPPRSPTPLYTPYENWPPQFPALTLIFCDQIPTVCEICIIWLLLLHLLSTDATGYTCVDFNSQSNTAQK